MLGLESFPSLSVAEFDKACETLVHRLSGSSLEVALKREGGTCFIEIKRSIDIERSKSCHLELYGRDYDEDWGDIDDDDKEVLPVPSERSEPMIMVEYHILLSPGYQVPVLYFRTIAHASGVSLAVSLPDIYNLLVDTDSRTQVENIGVMGGISQSDHPIFGHPFYFVHPCNTADAMREWEGDEMTSERYLMIWLGLVGPVVGLFLPADAIR